MFFAYNRVSTAQQHLDRGRDTINRFCKERGITIEKIFEDKYSGKKMDRPRYIVMKEDVLRSGDTLIIPEADRLGRNKKLVAEELEWFKQHNIRVMIINIPTTTIELPQNNDELYQLIVGTINQLVIDMYLMLAESELHMKEKRQREGIAAKKERGEWEDYGRPRKMTSNQFATYYLEVEKGEIKPFELMKKLNMKQSTFYRYVKEYKENKN